MNVYWSVLRERRLPDSIPFTTYMEPSSLTKTLMDIDTSVLGNNQGNFKLCPAVQDYCKNTFVLKFPFDYSLNFDNPKQIYSEMYDQEFFDGVVFPRSNEIGLHSLRINYVFISDEPLKIEISGAHLSNSEFSDKTKFIPATYDIGKWSRPLDCTFIVKKGINNIKFNKGEDWAYIKFLTQQKIKLKKFYPSDEIQNIIQSSISIRKNKKEFPWSLNKFYDIYKDSLIHKRIIQEINNNLM